MKAIGIKWDTDGDEKLLQELPSEIEIPKEICPDMDSEDECEEAISDYLSEYTGFCHSGFTLVEEDDALESGYSWPGIQKVSWEEIERLRDTNGLAGYFKLYDDGTEAMIEPAYDWAEIVKHHENGGEFGIEVAEEELSDAQLARNDEIYGAVYDMCKVICQNDSLEWDMHYIGAIAELAADLLVARGEKVRFPAVVTEQAGKQHIEEFYQ